MTQQWKLVPVEPTPKMIDATWNDSVDRDGGIESQNTRNRRIYAAMVNAAPTPPASAQDDAKDAARYRWLRDPQSDVALVLDKRTGYVPEDERIPGVGGYHTYEYRAGEELDSAIDKALAASQQQEG